MSETKFKVGNMILNRFLSDEDIEEALPETSPQTHDELDYIVSRWARRVQYFGDAYGKSKTQEEVSQLKVDILESKISSELREAMIERGEKIVESRVKSELVLDRRMMEARKAHAESIGIEESLLGAYRAIMRQEHQIQHWAARINNDARRDKTLTQQDTAENDVVERAKKLKGRFVA